MSLKYEIESKKMNKCPCKGCANELVCFDDHEACDKYLAWHKKMKRKKD